MATAKELKQKIKDGEVVVALRPPINISKADFEKALTKGTYDLVYIDGQHTPFSDDQLVAISKIAEDAGLPVQFRIPHTRLTFLIGRFLDMGLSGVLVPEVEEPSIAQEAVDYAYYAPVGKRSWGGSARYGQVQGGKRLSQPEYVEYWNNHVIVSVQIESIKAVESAASLAVPGLDYLAWGPNDLGLDLKRHPEYHLKTSDECTQYVWEQVKDKGIKMGMAILTEPEEREKYLKMGMTMFQEAPRK
jgi:2-keto-3-deoxy-L-rhamnonate aldolase RhmA